MCSCGRKTGRNPGPFNSVTYRGAGRGWVGGFQLSATPVLRLSMVLQLSPIHFNRAKQQYQTPPMDRDGAVLGGKQPYFFFQSWTILLRFPSLDLRAHTMKNTPHPYSSLLRFYKSLFHTWDCKMVKCCVMTVFGGFTHLMPPSGTEHTDLRKPSPMKLWMNTSCADVASPCAG